MLNRLSSVGIRLSLPPHRWITDGGFKSMDSGDWTWTWTCVGQVGIKFSMILCLRLDYKHLTLSLTNLHRLFMAIMGVSRSSTKGYLHMGSPEWMFICIEMGCPWDTTQKQNWECQLASVWKTKGKKCVHGRVDTENKYIIINRGKGKRSKSSRSAWVLGDHFNSQEEALHSAGIPANRQAILPARPTLERLCYRALRQFKIKRQRGSGEVEAAVVIVQTALASCRGWWYPARWAHGHLDSDGRQILSSARQTQRPLWMLLVTRARQEMLK